MAVSGFCPNCGERFGISPTGELQNRDPDAGYSSTWWRVDMHPALEWPADGIGPPNRIVCEGSGKKI